MPSATSVQCSSVIQPLHNQCSLCPDTKNHATRACPAKTLRTTDQKGGVISVSKLVKLSRPCQRTLRTAFSLSGRCGLTVAPRATAWHPEFEFSLKRLAASRQSLGISNISLLHADTQWQACMIRVSCCRNDTAATAATSSTSRTRSISSTSSIASASSASNLSTSRMRTTDYCILPARTPAAAAPTVEATSQRHGR